MSKNSKNTTKKDDLLTFRVDRLLEGLRDHLAQINGRKKLTLRTRTVSVPDPVKPFKPCEIVAIRDQLKMSQPIFAQFLNVPVATARSWESGRRKPTGAALRLLQIVKKSPQLVLKAAA